jgi:membrane protein YdbS with pleckstrin-like domain
MAGTNTNPSVPIETLAVNTPFVPTQRISTTTSLDGPPIASEPLYSPDGPQPAGTTAAASAEMAEAVDRSPEHGEGIEGEEVVWEGHYSMKNFAGRLTFRAVLSLAWLVMAVETWANGHGDWAIATVILGVILLIMWAVILGRIAQAHYGHFYRLTNRRLFVSTGVLQRRRDQMELLRVKDVFTRQTLEERWLSLGTVIVVSSERDLPVFYLTGVNDPKQVMDLVWHHARSERDNRSTRVQPI